MEPADYSPWKGALTVRRLPGRISAEACGALFQPGWFSMVLVRSGTLEICPEGGAAPLKLSAGCLCGITAGATVSAVAGPLRCHVLSCTIALAAGGRTGRYAAGHIEAATSAASVFPLSDAAVRHFAQLLEMLQRKMGGGGGQPLQDEMVMLCLELLLYEYSAQYLKNNEGRTVFRSWSEKIAMGFLALVEANAVLHHDVHFYADALCITHRHLRKAVRRATGRPAKYFIEARLVSEALALLADDSLSVTEVSENLNFGTLPSFSAFFKKHAGLSPSAYRLRLRR